MTSSAFVVGIKIPYLHDSVWQCLQLPMCLPATCDGFDCGDHGSCELNLKLGAVCRCEPGFAGPNCSTGNLNPHSNIF